MIGTGRYQAAPRHEPRRVIQMRRKPHLTVYRFPVMRNGFEILTILKLRTQKRNRKVSVRKQREICQIPCFFWILPNLFSTGDHAKVRELESKSISDFRPRHHLSFIRLHQNIGDKSANRTICEPLQFSYFRAVACIFYYITPFWERPLLGHAVKAAGVEHPTMHQHK